MKNKDGFTLLEISLTIAIILILSSVLVLGMPQFIAQAKTAATAADAHNNNNDAAAAQLGALNGAAATTATPTPVPAKITISAITGVKKPVKNAAAVTSVLPTAQYTMTVSWSPAPPGGVFAKNTTYTAAITITPNVGYSLDGVVKNYFKVSGGTATNSAGSASVKVVFPRTGS